VGSEDTFNNKGNDNLWHINAQEDIEYPFGLIPHCIYPQNHDPCNLKAWSGEIIQGVWLLTIRGSNKHRKLPITHQIDYSTLRISMPHIDIVEDSKLVYLHLELYQCSSHWQPEFRCIPLPKTIINNRQDGMQKN
jgi:hypothetical protein